LISLQNKQIKNKRLPFSNNIPQIKIKTHLTPYISKIYVMPVKACPTSVTRSYPVALTKNQNAQVILIIKSHADISIQTYVFFLF
jgi:hypothetical protein